jgi:hypothetical protein
MEEKIMKQLTEKELDDLFWNECSEAEARAEARMFERE